MNLEKKKKIPTKVVVNRQQFHLLSYTKLIIWDSEAQVLS